MKGLRCLCSLCVGVAMVAAPTLVGAAYAGDQYQATIVESPAAMLDSTPVNTSNFHLPKPGNKFVIKPSPASAPGTGITAQLILKNVECAPDDDKGVANKCGISQDVTKCTAAGKPHPCCTGHGTGNCDPQHGVLDMSVHQFFTSLLSGSADILHFAGIPITLKKGVATFDASGKNKIDGSQVFGGLIFPFLGANMGFHATEVRTSGTVPSDCAGVPPGPGCLDGVEWGVTGITFSP